MATTSSIIVLLKYFASKQKSAAIDFNEFCEYLKQYSRHHLEEQPVLSAYISDPLPALQKELDKLSYEKKVLVTTNREDKQVIIVIPYYVEKIAKRYKDIELNPTIPFPLESDLPKAIPAEIVSRKEGADFISQQMNSEELSDTFLYGIVLPHDSPTVLFPSNLPIKSLVAIALEKMRVMLNKEDHHDYFQKKISVSNPGREIASKNFFNRFTQTQEAPMDMIQHPDDSFYMWTQLCYFIKQDYEKVKDFTQEDRSILLSVYIAEIAASHFKTKNQEREKMENALRQLDQLLLKPPYYYSYEDITKFTNNAGLPLLTQYSEENLKNYLHQKSSEGSVNSLPELLVFKTEMENRYFIHKTKVLPLILRLCTDARETVRETIKDDWARVLKNFDELPEMKEQRRFEMRLEREVELQSPILYALLNASFLPLIYYETTNSNDFGGAPIHVLANGKLIPYSELLLMNRGQLYTDAKLLLPLWYTFPVISWIAKLLFGKSKKKRGKREKTAQEIYKEKEAQQRNEDKRDAQLARNTSFSKKLALRESARVAEDALVPPNSTLDRELESYRQQWNKKIDKNTNDQLTQDVNSLIRDYLRKVLRSINTKGFTLDRIQSLAETLVKTPGMQRVGEHDALLMYCELFMIKLVKNIPV